MFSDWHFVLFAVIFSVALAALGLIYWRVKKKRWSPPAFYILFLFFLSIFCVLASFAQLFSPGK